MSIAKVEQFYIKIKPLDRAMIENNGVALQELVFF
jgi:hypothetical protein